jgi:cytochrome oxidase assembly protein ShyY1
MNPEDVRRMVGGWQAVERREREERRRAGPDSAAAVEGALAPPAESEARRRDNELARARWVRVRNFYQAHGKAAKPKDS